MDIESEVHACVDSRRAYTHSGDDARSWAMLPTRSIALLAFCIGRSHKDHALQASNNELSVTVKVMT